MFLDLYAKYGDSFEYIWCRNEYDTELAAYSNVRTVKFRSPRYVFALCTCGVYVTNNGVDSYIPKRKKQLFIDTWHGGGAYKSLDKVNKQSVVEASRRPVLYSSDAVSAILTVMLKGGRGGVYTAANPATFATIRETAEMVAREIAGGRIGVRYDIQDAPAEYAPNLNVDKLRSLGWRSSVDLRDAYGRMIAAMREEKSEGVIL